MVLICGGPNEGVWFTWSTQGRFYFPHSSNNSQWVCLCSDFNLRALRSCWRTLMFCLNELTVLVDTALQSTDSPLASTYSVTCDKHFKCSAVPNFESNPQKSHTLSSATLQITKKKDTWLLFPAMKHLSRSLLMCEAGFCYLTALQH